MDPGDIERLKGIVLEDLETNQEYQWLQEQVKEAYAIGRIELALVFEVSMSDMRNEAVAPFVKIQAGRKQRRL